MALAGILGIGLSPRVRGNLHQRGSRAATSGSIPARAGEPAELTLALLVNGVYPRACGGTRPRAPSVASAEGLSPRVRGNPGTRRRGGLAAGSIPARAGEPCSSVRSVPKRKVYPRACGGNRARKFCRPAVDGSIPARAGEPTTHLQPWRPHTVYPRACGGTHSRALQPELIPGLSPRVRGNLPDKGAFAKLQGSIPARAGEPLCECECECDEWVYPRACGGTAALRCCWPGVCGLSPRVRGNLGDNHGVNLAGRSIPARAGEPPCGSGAVSARRVYPRACGGTVARVFHRPPGAGLSPRVRGNRALRLAQRIQERSIPARAGEPGLVQHRHDVPWVYPRACGGTRRPRPPYSQDWGLSPRVRGNPLIDLAGIIA